MFISFLKNIHISFSRKAVSLYPYRSVVSFSSSAASAESESKSQQLIITESCIERLKKIAPEGSFLRITIDGGGCSGFQYKFDLDSKLQDDDVCFDRDGAKVVVDQISLDFLKGSTVDFKEELIRASFSITNNPQAESKCSCGTSFAVKVQNQTIALLDFWLSFPCVNSYSPIYYIYSIVCYRWKSNLIGVLCIDWHCVTLLVKQLVILDQSFAGFCVETLNLIVFSCSFK